ncbi:MAG: DNA gyrase subunit A [Candidatus Binatia bacterium]
MDSSGISKGNRIPVAIEDEMRQSFMDYAMSVIISRALPDARDGLKPVHRRALYAMYDLNNDWNRAYKKSARIVGDVIGKYHPHGDSAVYDTIVRMVQDFSLRYPLVDGQGNFGSIDGDPPAAMRYTEVRMARITSEMLADLDKETVDFKPNYDETTQEPVVLPARIPNLLINGSSGIAVGMATNIPPHNLREVVDGLIALLEDPNLSSGELMRYIPGPDFPTAGFLHGRASIREAYLTGRGVLQLRARTEIEESDKGKTKIIVRELPYQVNKARLIERIAEMVHDKRIEGISDLRDESDRDGMRVVIELKRDAVTEVVQNQLFKLTQLQDSFGVNMLAIVAGRPKLLTLKDALVVFIEHRKDVVTRRTVYELRKAQERLHILDGLKIALDNLDAVIALIRAATDPATARTGLMSQFGLSEIQAQAILEMRLQRLTNMERDKILEERDEVLRQIARFQEILGDEREVAKIIATELGEIRAQYGDERRTVIVDDSTDLDIEDLIAEEDMVVTVSHEGYIKRNPVAEYRAQRRGGRGKIGATTKDEDFIEHLFVASTHAYLLVFTTSGKLYWLKVHTLPLAGRAARGKAIVNLLSLQAGEKVSAFLTVREFSAGGRYVLFATKEGVVKKTALDDYANPRPSGIIAIKINVGDEVIGVRLTDGSQEVILSTQNGQAIRFRESDVRPMGRNAAGVRGITLEAGDSLVAVDVVTPDATLLAVAERGYGKRTAVDEYRLTNRGGKGIITMNVTDKVGRVVGVRLVRDDDDLMLVTDAGKVIRMPVRDISVIGRNTQGVRLIDVAEGEKVVGVACLAEKEAEADKDAEPGSEPDAEPTPG